MLPPTPRNLRTFGLLLAGLLAALGALLSWRSARLSPPPALLLFAAALLSAALAWRAPSALRWVYVPWMAAAHLFGQAMTWAILTLLFFTFLIPFVLIRFKDPLRLRRGGASYWEQPRYAESSLERFRRPF